MKKILLLTLYIFLTINCQSQGIGCWANFYYTQNGPTTIFTDNSFVAPANSWENDHSLSWLWDFGDGNTSNLEDPTHNYSNGTYIPCLTLTMFDSTVMNTCVSTICDTIIIGSTTNLSNYIQTNFNKKVLNIIDVLGRESKEKKNTPLYYIYDDGRVEKRIIIE